MTTPTALISAYERWNRAGRPTQVASVWKRSLWLDWLPEHEPFLTGLNTDRLDRGQAVEISPPVESEEQAVEVFLLAMLWGYGLGGLGPFRTRRVLDQPNAKSELFEVAREAQAKGGLAAFRLVAERRNKSSGEFLKWLGPAFGTKFIYFLTAKIDPTNPTPVMDSVVSNWFRKNAPDRPLRVNYWHSPSYELFLESLQEWAEDLSHRYGQEILPDDVEYLIFAEGNRFEGNDRFESWEPEERAVSPSLLFDQLKALANYKQDNQYSLELINKLEAHLLRNDESDQL